MNTYQLLLDSEDCFNLACFFTGVQYRLMSELKDLKKTEVKDSIDKIETIVLNIDILKGGFTVHETELYEKTISELDFNRIINETEKINSEVNNYLQKYIITKK